METIEETIKYHVRHMGASPGVYDVLNKRDKVVGTGRVIKVGGGDYKVEFRLKDSDAKPKIEFAKLGAGEKTLVELAEAYFREKKKQ